MPENWEQNSKNVRPKMENSMLIQTNQDITGRFIFVKPINNDKWLFIDRISRKEKNKYLHEHSRTKVLVSIPPVTRTTSAAACTQNAFIQAIL